MARENSAIQHKDNTLSQSKQQTALGQTIQQSLNSPGQPLTRELRQEMEQRFTAQWPGNIASRSAHDSHQIHFKAIDFNPVANRYEQQAEAIGTAVTRTPFPTSGHINDKSVDFSQVRIHHDPKAVASAHHMDAQAYTLGHHIVFGRSNPAFSSGMQRQILAHELTHVLQQQSESHLPGKIFFRGRTAGGFFRNIGRGIISIFTDEPDYDDEVLLSYLRLLDTEHDIEGDYDSDNKARFVVARWVNNNTSFVLTTALKILLIREMLSGFTGNPDEDAILTLMQGSNDLEVRDMLEQIGEQLIRSNFHGEQSNSLNTLIDETRQRIQSGQANVTPAPEADTGIERRFMHHPTVALPKPSLLNIAVNFGNMPLPPRKAKTMRPMTDHCIGHAFP